MRTALADAKIKLRIMTMHDELRHAVEDHGPDSNQVVDAREDLRNAIRFGFDVGLTNEDLQRITSPNSRTLADRALHEALAEHQVLEGPVLTQEDIAAREAVKPRPVRRRTRKAVESAPKSSTDDARW